MSWTGTRMPSYMKKKDFLEKELFGYSGLKFTVLQHSTKGSVHYLAIRHNDTDEVFARVVLTSTNKRLFESFYYKSINETCEPFYYDAPASLLKKLTPTTNECALAWREKCWERINASKEKKVVKVEDGMRIRFAEPIEFTNREILDTFTVRKYGKKTRFIDGMCQYRISGWQNREFEII